MAKATVSINTAGWPTLFTLAFIILKATGYLDWSWWWVFSPMWICASIWLAVIGFFFGLAIIGAILK